MNNLIKQLKNAEFEGVYYIETINGEIYNVEFQNTISIKKKKLLKIKSFKGYIHKRIVKNVLAPVPSYEEWQQLKKWCEEFNALDVAKENQQLKEEIKSLKEAIYDLDGLKCPKCGNYHRRGWTCSQCGYGK